MVSNSLEVPWILVIVLCVVCTAQGVYIFIQWRAGRHGGAGVRRRPITEQYQLTRPARGGGDAFARGTGYSPIEPPRTRWSRY